MIKTMFGRVLNSDIAGEESCSRDQTYKAIIISIVPLWVIITVLVIFALLLVSKHVRLTKIYDNCTKGNASFVYHVEIRTGDTSATYVRRKTTITIDMFDENQTTLARIAIPGHVIFGRKDEPVAFLDDDKFFELRVTRMWLYRSSRLRKVSTIRLTHTCMEPEARIMIYGVELRLEDAERNKLFFPVMNYITPYGTSNKINACFDIDQVGTISAMGGRIEPSLISEQLFLIDDTVLVYLYCAIGYYLSTYELVQGSFIDSAQSALKGLIIGSICFAITGTLTLLMRYVVKRQYSYHVGAGFWGYFYHVMNGLIVVVATVFWVYAIVVAQSDICSNHHTVWLLSLCVAGAVGFAYALLISFGLWIKRILNPPPPDQFAIPEDSANVTAQTQTQTHDQEPGTGGAPGIRTLEAHQSKSRPGGQATRHSPIGASPSALMMPAMGAPSNITGMPSWQQGTPAQAPPPPPPPMPNLPMMHQTQHGYSPYQPVYMQQPPPPPPQQQPQQQHLPTMFKGAAGYGGYDTTGHFQQGPNRLPTFHPTPSPAGPSYHQQMTNTITTISGRKTKKTGSNESTGSTYYQQLMKNKGGVKSISQYGELMKQKKNKR